MKEIVEEIRKEIADKAEEAKNAKIKSFVRIKLSRLEQVEKNIETYREERTKIEESLTKIEKGDYDEVNFNESPVTGCTVEWNFVPSGSYYGTGYLSPNNKTLTYK